jgi:hypothetical protein
MEKIYRQILLAAGTSCFVLALFQAVIGFSPSLSLYFGAPEALVESIYTLIAVSLFIAALLTVFGLYAFSGAGHIRTLPWIKQILAAISCIFLLRGFLLIPEFLVVMGIYEISIPVAPRFVFFSLGSLLIGFIFIIGTIGRWNSFSKTTKSRGQ